jgi:hypothetical protein
MKKFLILLLFLIWPVCSATAQVSINTTGDPPDNSAMLDINSTTGGVLIPRMTQSEINSIFNPADGLQVYCTSNSRIYLYVASEAIWKELAYGTGTISPWSCGNTITINHSISGGVAPVNKTVTYGTVTNIPRQTTKCWITSNLGADHQASSVDDATEASSGWYWQFNRKQGYKYDGIRMPNTTWVTSIDEDLDWQTDNDPCALELGGGWHIPTYTEWENVYWYNCSWESALKIHAAGYIEWNTGLLNSRGWRGQYWHSGQYSSSIGALFGIDMATGCFMTIYPKSYGNTLRCIKD